MKKKIFSMMLVYSASFVSLFGQFIPNYEEFTDGSFYFQGPKPTSVVFWFGLGSSANDTGTVTEPYSGWIRCEKKGVSPAIYVNPIESAPGGGVSTAVPSKEYANAYFIGSREETLGKTGFYIGNQWRVSSGNHEATYIATSSTNGSTDIGLVKHNSWNIKLGGGSAEGLSMERDLFIVGNNRGKGGNTYRYEVNYLNLESGHLFFKSYVGNNSLTAVPPADNCLYASITNSNFNLTFTANETIKVNGGGINFGTNIYDYTQSKSPYLPIAGNYMTVVTLGKEGGSQDALILNGGYVNFVVVDEILINNKIKTEIGTSLNFASMGTKLTFKDSIEAKGKVIFKTALAGVTVNAKAYTGLSEITFPALKNGVIFSEVDFSALSLKDTSNNYLVSIKFDGIENLDKTTILMTWDTLSGTTSEILRQRANAGLPASATGIFEIRNNSLVYLMDEPVPVVLSQPMDQLVSVGGTATFSVGVNVEMPNFQWQISTDGVSWSNISGATDSVLTISNVQLTSDGYKYKCIVTNSSGFVISNEATLSVVSSPITIPEITLQPVDKTATEGKMTLFVLEATGIGLRFQWQVSTDGINWASLTNENNSTLTLFNIQMSMDGNVYRCLITNPIGTVISNSATLTVEEAVLAPSIIRQPVNQTVPAKSTARFGLIVNGVSLTYQWQYSKDGVNWEDILTGTSDTLALAQISDSMNGYTYRCIVSNVGGSVTSQNVVLKVEDPISNITIVKDITSFTLYEKEYSTLTVMATTNVGAVKYLWQVDKNDGNGWVNAGSTTNNLKVTATTALVMNNWKYRCMLTNGISSDTAYSDVATLTVCSLVSISKQPILSKAYSNGGTSLSIVSTNNPDDPTRYQWEVYKYGLNPRTYKIEWFWDKVSDTDYIKGSNSATLEFSNLLYTENGVQYRCVVSNGGSSATSSVAKLVVDRTVEIIEPYIVSQAKEIGETVSWTVKTVGASPIKYQWQIFENGEFVDITKEIAVKYAINASSTGATYSIPKLTIEDHNNLKFRCIVSNGGTSGIETGIVTLNVTKKTEVKNSFTSILLFKDTLSEVGENTIYVNASAEESIMYRWEVYEKNLSTNKFEWHSIPNGSGKIDAENFDIKHTVEAKDFVAGMKYRCIVWSGKYENTKEVQSKDIALVLCDRTTITETVGVHNPFAFDENEYQQLPAINYQATFAITAKGTSLSYQWQESLDNGNSWENIPNAKSNKFVTPKLSSDDFNKLYKCLVINTAGTVESEVYSITKIRPVEIAESPEPLVVCTNLQTAEFKVVPTKASGNPDKLTYRWFVSTDGGNTYKAQAGGKQTLSIIRPAVGLNNNLYKCQVLNVYDLAQEKLNKEYIVATSEASKLEVKAPAVIVTQPKAVTTYEGGDATLEVKANAYRAKYQWQWSINGKDWFDISNETKSILTLNNVSYANGTQFRCQVWSGEGVQSLDKPTLSAVVKLTVNAKIEIASTEIIQGTLKTLCDGSAVRLYSDKSYPVEIKVTLEKGFAPKYQWYMDGVAIPRATVASYKVADPLSLANKVLYCEVTNSLGDKQRTNEISFNIEEMTMPSLLSGFVATAQFTSGELESLGMNIIFIDGANCRIVNSENTTELEGRKNQYINASYSYRRTSPEDATFTLKFTQTANSGLVTVGTYNYTGTFKLNRTTRDYAISLENTQSKLQSSGDVVIGNSVQAPKTISVGTELYVGDVQVLKITSAKNCEVYRNQETYSATYTFVYKANSVCLLAATYKIGTITIVEEYALSYADENYGESICTLKENNKIVCVTGGVFGYGMPLLQYINSYQSMSSGLFESMSLSDIEGSSLGNDDISDNFSSDMLYLGESESGYVGGDSMFVNSGDNISIDSIIFEGKGVYTSDALVYIDADIGYGMKVVAMGNNLKYQWYESINGIDFSLISGATQIWNNIKSSSGTSYYKCKVYNSEGEKYTGVITVIVGR